MNNESRSQYIKLIAHTAEPRQLNLINGLNLVYCTIEMT